MIFMIAYLPVLSNSSYSAKYFNDVSKVSEDADISGTVTDENGLGLPGVTVHVKGTSEGTITDMDGNFNLIELDIEQREPYKR